MRIDHLDLTNFKNFSHLAVDFQPGVNLFVGGNGSGKTSLLEGINVALGGFFASPSIETVRPIKESEIRITPGTPFPVRSVNATVHACSAIIDNSWLRVKRSGNKMSETFVDPFIEPDEEKPISKEKLRLAQYNRVDEYGESIFAKFEDNNDRTVAPLIAYYSTQRLFKDAKQTLEEKYDAPNGRRNGYLQCLEEKAIKPVLDEWLGKAVTLRATKQIKEIENNDNIVDNVEKAIRDTIKDFIGIADNFRLEIYQHPFFNNELFVHYDEAHDLPLSLYSDGFRNLLYLVIDLVWRASHLNPWLSLAQIKAQVTGVVTIDEIDLHLHPKWQAKAIGLIQSLLPKVQFFITTHSPTVVANFEGGTLYVIDGNKVIKHPEAYFGKAVNTILRDVLGADDRHKPTQAKIDQLLRKIGNEAPLEEINPLLDELIALLGLEDADIQSALSLMEWNKIKNEDEHAIHS